MKMKNTQSMVSSSARCYSKAIQCVIHSTPEKKRSNYIGRMSDLIVVRSEDTQSASWIEDYKVSR